MYKGTLALFKIPEITDYIRKCLIINIDYIYALKCIRKLKLDPTVSGV